MAYLFFLGAVPLPITPSALTIKTPSMNKTVTLVNEGEINIPKRSGLREISFEFLLPQVQKYPFANYQLGSYTASVMIPLLNVWKNTCIPFRFIVTRMSPSGGILYFTYIKCVIEDFEYNEDAEAHGLDVMCSINLKEYVDYGTKIVDVKDVQNQHSSTTKQATVTQTRASKPVPNSVTGDTWTTAAGKAGNTNDWRLVADSNNVCVYPESPLDSALGLNSYYNQPMMNNGSLPQMEGVGDWLFSGDSSSVLDYAMGEEAVKNLSPISSGTQSVLQAPAAGTPIITRPPTGSTGRSELINYAKASMPGFTGFF